MPRHSRRKYSQRNKNKKKSKRYLGGMEGGAAGGGPTSVDRGNKETFVRNSIEQNLCIECHMPGGNTVRCALVVTPIALLVKLLNKEELSDNNQRHKLVNEMARQVCVSLGNQRNTIKIILNPKVYNEKKIKQK